MDNIVEGRFEKGGVNNVPVTPRPKDSPQPMARHFEDFEKGYYHGVSEATRRFVKSMSENIAALRNPPPIVMPIETEMIGKIWVDEEDLRGLFSDSKANLNEIGADNDDYEELRVLHKKYFPGK